jgi:outer membrane lipoprotein-sorting protein
MKKFISATILIFGIAFLFGCGSDPDKEEMINDRISALESAINSLNYNAYMDCFDDSTSYKGAGTYLIGDFTAEYNTPHIDYTFKALTINGNTVTCFSTKSTTGLTEYANVFEMVETDGDWYISLWTEDGTIIFQSPKRAKK